MRRKVDVRREQQPPAGYKAKSEKNLTPGDTDNAIADRGAGYGCFWPPNAHWRTDKQDEPEKQRAEYGIDSGPPTGKRDTGHSNS